MLATSRIVRPRNVSSSNLEAAHLEPSSDATGQQHQRQQHNSQKLPEIRSRKVGEEEEGRESGQEEEEVDEERKTLIAGFKEYLKHSVAQGNEPVAGQEIGTEQVKVDHLDDVTGQKTGDKSAAKLASTRDRDTCFKGTQETSDDKMKYDYKRDHPDTMCSGKNAAKNALNYKKTYLFLYNLAMFIMFLMVHIIMTIKGLAGKMDDESVQGAAFIIKLLTYTQLLESIHPMLGLVPGGPFMPFLQVIGRLLVNHFLTDPEIRLNSAPYAHYLFIVWSSIEIFRYSFYALRVFNVEIYPITWCRYTLFMPLYPMGGFCEAQIVMATVRHFEKTGAYTTSLPNPANFSFSLPTFLRFYTVALLGPSIFYLMRYMWAQRCKQLKQKTD